MLMQLFFAKFFEQHLNFIIKTILIYIRIVWQFAVYVKANKKALFLALFYIYYKILVPYPVMGR